MATNAFWTENRFRINSRTQMIHGSRENKDRHKCRAKHLQFLNLSYAKRFSFLHFLYKVIQWLGIGLFQKPGPKVTYFCRHWAWKESFDFNWRIANPNTQRCKDVGNESHRRTAFRSKSPMTSWQFCKLWKAWLFLGQAVMLYWYALLPIALYTMQTNTMLYWQFSHCILYWQISVECAMQ